LGGQRSVLMGHKGIAQGSVPATDSDLDCTVTTTAHMDGAGIDHQLRVDRYGLGISRTSKGIRYVYGIAAIGKTGKGIGVGRRGYGHFTYPSIQMETIASVPGIYIQGYGGRIRPIVTRGRTDFKINLDRGAQGDGVTTDAAAIDIPGQDDVFPGRQAVESRP